MPHLTFELITPQGVTVSESVYEVTLPTPQGEIGILPHHVPLVSLASPGVISMRRQAGGPVEHIATSGGMIEIDGQHIRLLADTAERAEAIDELRAKEALQKAMELKHTAADHVSLADATRIIERNLARLKVAELRKRHHS